MVLWSGGIQEFKRNKPAEVLGGGMRAALSAMGRGKALEQVCICSRKKQSCAPEAGQWGGQRGGDRFQQQN